MHKIQYYIFISIVALMTACRGNEQLIIVSPDQTLEVVISQTDEGTATWKLCRKTDDKCCVELISPSILGLIVNGVDFSKNITISGISESKSTHEQYSLLSGKTSNVDVSSIDRTITLCDIEERKLLVHFRVFNDGMAFQYEVIGDGDLSINNEATTFAVQADSVDRAWMAPYDKVTKYSPGYETFYSDAIAIGTKAPENSTGWAFPMLFNTKEHWLLITEAGVEAFNYGGTHLKDKCENGTYEVCFAQPDEAFNCCSNIPVLKNHGKTNWRVVYASRDIGDLIASNLVTALNPQSKYVADWVKPGVSSWSWWSDNDSPKNYESMLPYIDLAASLHWSYFLVDANWNQMKGGTLEDVVKYARCKDVNVMVWYNSGGPNNIVTEQPRDRMNDRKIRRTEMAWLQKIGIKGIKVDFFQSDKPAIISLYKEILEDAMDYQLLVNFHGGTLPKGWERTYPNLMTFESVRGSENYGFSDVFPELAPSQNTILCYTRNVVGPMDYTPTTFTNIKYPHLTTKGHELALSVLFQSGLTHIADAVSGILSTPDYVQDFFRILPTSWNQVKYLYGTPGKDIVLARQYNGDWYVGGINGEQTSKTITIDTSFFNGRTITLITDGEEKGFRKENLKAPNSLSINMEPFGGFVITCQ